MRNWERELYRQLKASQAVVALCSEHSMASEWCFAEVTQSRALGKPVFAVRIDGCVLKPLFRQEQTVDFVSNQIEALERLARGLKLAGLDPRDSFKWDEGRSWLRGATSRFSQASPRRLAVISSNLIQLRMRFLRSKRAELVSMPVRRAMLVRTQPETEP